MRLALIAGTENPALARSISHQLGVDCERCRIERFPDGEIGVSIAPVRGADVYLVQGTAPPVHDNLAELLMLADAARRAGADRVTGVVPYVAYGRRDRRATEGDSLGGRVIADALSRVLDRIVTIDLHAAALEGFFSCALEPLSAIPLLAERIRRLVHGHVVVAPDLGAVKRAERYARALGLAVATVRKRRLSGLEVEVLGVDGDVTGRDVLIVDDMISTGATVAAAANALRAAGARHVVVVATHGLLVPPAQETLGRTELEAIVVSDSVSTRAEALPRLTVVGLAPLLADAIGRLHREAPLAELVSTR